MNGWRKYLPWVGIGALVTFMAIAVVAFDGEDQAPAPDTGDRGQATAVIGAGEVMYEANCAVCHGTDLRGTATGPSHLSIVYEPNHHGDAAFVFAVRRGVQQHHWPFGDMEPVPGLSDDDIAAIIAYVRDQQRIHGFEPYPPEQ